MGALELHQPKHGFSRHFCRKLASNLKLLLDMRIIQKAHLLELFAQKVPAKYQRIVESIVDLPIPQYFRTIPLLFIHVPKCAGISIARQLYGRRIAHRPISFYINSDPTWLQTITSFAIIRNPYDRLVSAYEYSRQNGTDSATVDPAFYRQVQKYPNFERFVLEYLAPRTHAINILDPVIRPQAFYICDDGGNPVVSKLFLFNELSDVVPFCQRFGISFRADIHSNRTPLRFEFERYYDNLQVCKVVERIYKRDFHIYNFLQNSRCGTAQSMAALSLSAMMVSKPNTHEVEHCRVMEQHKPKYSIVTATRMARCELEKTYQSLLCQTNHDFEWIVLDCQSQDGTATFLQSISTAPFKVIWVSESDKGIADAWNKGIKMAVGSSILILNAGDTYDPAMIATINQHDDGRKIVCSQARLLTVDGRQIGLFRARPQRLWLGMYLPHNWCAVPRQFYDELGPYALIPDSMDFDWFNRYYKRYGSAGFKVVHSPLGNYHIGGHSYVNFKKGFAANRRILEHNGVSPYVTGLIYHFNVFKHRLRNKINHV